MDFQNRGYVSVTGINNCVEDNARSNGAGKCFGRGTKIMMSDGTVKSVEDVQVGDYVMGWDSTPRRVVEAHNGVGKLYKVSGLTKNKTDYSYICNDEHLLCLKKTCGGINGAPEINISIPDFQKLPQYLQAYYNQYIVPIIKFNREDTKLRLNPYWLGVWLGDGTSNKPQITTMDEEIVETCNDIANYYGLRVVPYEKKINNKAKSYDMVCGKGKRGHNGFINDLKAIGVFGNKHIPQDYLLSSYEDRMSLLCGLLDTDGGREGYALYITQERKELAEQIVFLSRSLGFKTTIGKKFVKKYNKVYFRVGIYGETWKIPLRVKHKIIEEHYTQRPHTLGTHIEDAGVGEYFGFQIEGDGKFLLSDCTVVHNSSAFSAICYALCGETIQGVKSNLVNIFHEGGLRVELDFDVDNNSYKIIRTKEHKDFGTTIKFYVNGEDKSGKGVRDTEKILSEYLGEITSDVIGGVIILGQGLPMKFTNNTPSGRKEVLEKLSKSDFMIDDIKDRLSKRKTNLNSMLHDYELNIAKYNSEKTIYENQLNKLNNDLSSLVMPNEYEIQELNDRIVSLRNELDNNEKDLSNKKSELNTLLQSQTDITSEMNNKVYEVKNKYQEILSQYKSEMKSSEMMANSLYNEIKKLKEITDICPTCGQKLPNVHKVDTTDKEHELNAYRVKYTELKEKIRVMNEEMSEETSKIETTFSSAKIDIINSISSVRNEISNLTSISSSLNSEILHLSTNVSKLTALVDNYQAQKASLEKSISDTTLKLQETTDNLLYNTMSAEDVEHRLEVVNKMITIATRDFRGQLLTNVISYINNRVKVYSNDIFGTDKLSLSLDGNNLNVEYNNKLYENLSGGEQRKVDLALQFSIRDMLSQFSNFSSSILVLDEIFESLDSVGCQRLIDTIANRLTDIESIFIITHRGDLSLPVDSTLTVVKNTNGVSEIKDAI